MMTFKIWLAVILACVLVSSLPNTFAEIEKGYNHNHEDLGNQVSGWASHPERIIDYYDSNQNPVYVNYRLFDTPTYVQLETQNSGSFIFDKSTCSYTLYESGYIGGANTPKIKNISWTVKGKLASSQIWSNVNSVNNAGCQVSLETTEDSVTVTGSKVNSVGTFQIELYHKAGAGIKETMRGYNNNPAWTNHNIGFTETFEVPQMITLGNHTYNLANYNNTILDRNWVESNQAKLIKLSDKISYDFGIGFDSLNDIKIIWDGAKAKLVLNYLYPTQTVPYQTWFEVDPTFNSLTSNQGRVYSTDAGANCATLTGTNADTTLKVAKNTASTGCQMVWQEFDISTIPSTATVISAYVEWDQTGTSSWIQDCGLYAYATQPSTLSTADKWSQGWGGTGSGTTTLCTTDGNDKQLTLNSTGIANLQSNISGSEGWWGAMFQGISGAADATNREFSMTASETRLNVVYTSPVNPPTNFDCQSIGRTVSCTWAASTPTSGSQNGIDSYIFGRSLNNVTFTNKTSVGNVTSLLSTAYWKINGLYYVNLTASDTGNTNSSASFGSFTTDNYPTVPLSPYTTPISETRNKINWSSPSSDGEDSIDQYRIEACLVCTSWTLLSNNTVTLNYNHTGLSGGEIWTYRLAAWNGVGLSPYTANFTGTTWTTTTGTITLIKGNVGDVVNINGTITITAGSPTPFTVQDVRLYRNNTLIQTNTTDMTITSVGGTALSRIWYQITNDGLNIFHVQATLTNSSGTVNLSSTNTNVTREYDPFYFTAEDPALGPVNHTESRSDDGDFVYLKVNRDMGGTTFPVSCLYQTLFEALANDGEGTWYNITDSGWYNATVPVESIPTIYITCVNPPNILFTTTLYSEENPLAAGIALFDAFGGILGAPSIILIVLAIFSLATGKNSPQVLVLALIVIGVLTSIGLIVFEANIFPMILVAGAVGIFAMRRYYF